MLCARITRRFRPLPSQLSFVSRTKRILYEKKAELRRYSDGSQATRKKLSLEDLQRLIHVTPAESDEINKEFSLGLKIGDPFGGISRKLRGAATTEIQHSLDERQQHLYDSALHGTLTLEQRQELFDEILDRSRAAGAQLRSARKEKQRIRELRLTNPNHHYLYRLSHIVIAILAIVAFYLSGWALVMMHTETSALKQVEWYNHFVSTSEGPLTVINIVNYERKPTRDIQETETLNREKFMAAREEARLEFEEFSMKQQLSFSTRAIEKLEQEISR